MSIRRGAPSGRGAGTFNVKFFLFLLEVQLFPVKGLCTSKYEKEVNKVTLRYSPELDFCYRECAATLELFCFYIHWEQHLRFAESWVQNLSLVVGRIVRNKLLQKMCH